MPDVTAGYGMFSDLIVFLGIFVHNLMHAVYMFTELSQIVCPSIKYNYSMPPCHAYLHDTVGRSVDMKKEPL